MYSHYGLLCGVIWRHDVIDVIMAWRQTTSQNDVSYNILWHTMMFMAYGVTVWRHDGMWRHSVTSWRNVTSQCDVMT